MNNIGFQTTISLPQALLDKMSAYVGNINAYDIVRAKRVKRVNIYLTKYHKRFIDLHLAARNLSRWLTERIEANLALLPKETLFFSLNGLVRFVVNREIWKNGVIQKRIVIPQLKAAQEKKAIEEAKASI